MTARRGVRRWKVRRGAVRRARKTAGGKVFLVFYCYGVQL